MKCILSVSGTCEWRSLGDESLVVVVLDSEVLDRSRQRRERRRVAGWLASSKH